MQADEAAAALAAATFGLQRYAHWSLLNYLPGRRALARCRCGTVRQLSVDAIESGTAAESCGCVAPSKQQRQAQLAEMVESARRNMLHDWRPGS